MPWILLKPGPCASAIALMKSITYLQFWLSYQNSCASEASIPLGAIAEKRRGHSLPGRNPRNGRERAMPPEPGNERRTDGLSFNGQPALRVRLFAVRKT